MPAAHDRDRCLGGPEHADMFIARSGLGEGAAIAFGGVPLICGDDQPCQPPKWRIARTLALFDLAFVKSLAVAGAQLLKGGAGSFRFSAMSLDGRGDRVRAPVVQKMLAKAEAHQELGSELRRRRETETDVRELGPHFVEQKVGIEVDGLSIEGLDLARPGLHRGNVAAGAADLLE